MMKIRKVSNGYIVEGPLNELNVYKTLDEVFEELLLHFEGLAESFRGSSYGKVKIIRDLKDSAPLDSDFNETSDHASTQSTGERK